MKVLQVGLGNFGKHHLKALSDLGHEVYVADLSEDALKICSQYDIPSGRTSMEYRNFLKKVDAIDVVTPANQHFEVVMHAIEIGKPVFVEKPIAYNSAQGIKIAELANENKVIVQVGHLYRFNPAMQYIHKAISDDKIGNVRYVSGNFSELKRARTDVGVTLTDAIHYIDLANLCFGRYPEYVYASVKDNFNRGMDDFGLLLLDYANCGIAKIETGIIQPGRSREFNVVGSKGIIEADMEGQKVKYLPAYHEYDGKTYVVKKGEVESPLLATTNPLQDQLRAFFNSIEYNVKPEMDAVTATNVVKIVETAYQSAKEGRRLEFIPFKLK